LCFLYLRNDQLGDGRSFGLFNVIDDIDVFQFSVEKLTAEKVEFICNQRISNDLNFVAVGKGRSDSSEALMLPTKIFKNINVSDWQAFC